MTSPSPMRFADARTETLTSCDRVNTRPAVLFVDEWGWDCFFQLAAVVRSEGFRTIRVSIRAPGRVASQLGLLFDRTVVLDSSAELEDLPEILRGESIVDVQAVESLGVAAYSAVRRLVSESRTEDLVRRSDAIDKLVVSRTLGAAGIDAPSTLSVESCSPSDAAEQLGLPIVYKQRVGSGGQGVRVVRTLAELEDIVAADEQTSQAYFERFVQGRTLNVGVLVSTEDIRLGAAWESAARTAALGPSSAIETVELAELRRIARDVVSALGLHGFVCLGIIEDVDGRLWVHDVNPRIWGSFVPLTEAGTDFAAGYVAWLHDERPSDEPRWATPGIRARVFPGEISGLLANSRPVALRQLVRSLRTYGKRLGWRYVAFIVLSRRGELARVLTARRQPRRPG